MRHTLSYGRDGNRHERDAMIRKSLCRFFFGDETTADSLQFALILALVSTSAVAAIAALAVS